MNKRRLLFTISNLTALFVVSYAAYYLLLADNFLHISIASIMSSSHHVATKQHLFILGLLPIYIATTIFGAAILCIYLGARIETFLKKKVGFRETFATSNVRK
jgi:hypothetical protein